MTDPADDAPHDDARMSRPGSLGDREVDARFAEIVRDFGSEGTHRWRGGQPLDLDQLGSGATQEPEFVAPDPPAPRGGITFWAVTACLVVGPLAMLWGFVLNSDDGSLARWLGVGLTALGLVLLLTGLQSDEERDDDLNDGAVV